jgi:hypothetical protein
MLSGELLLRTTTRKIDSSDFAVTFHPEYLIAMKPGLKRSFTRVTKSGEIVTHWNTNADGFRGDEIQRRKQGQRIIVYGDSNVFAKFSNLEDTFPYQLGKALQRFTPQRIEVINAGVDGFGPDQSLLRFEEEADLYQPDIVVLHIFADNDFGDIIRNRLFDVDPSGALVKTPHVRTVDHCLDPHAQSCRPRADERATTLRDFASSLRMVQAIQAVSKRFGLVNPPREPSPDVEIQYYLSVARAEYAVYKQGEPRMYSHFADHYDYDVALFPASESSVAKVQLMDAILLKLSQFAQARHVKLFVLIQPSSRDLTIHLLPNYKDFAKYPTYRNTNLTSAVEGILQARHIPGLNLFETFAKNDPESLFFEDNDHWNEAGQSLAARETALYIHDMLLKQ